MEETIPEEDNAPSFIDNLKAKFHYGVEFIRNLGKNDYTDVESNKSDTTSTSSGTSMSSSISDTTCTTRTSMKSVMNILFICHSNHFGCRS